LSHFISPHKEQSLAAVVPEIHVPTAEWKALLEKLREIERQEWPAICEGMVMSEVMHFAEGLQSLAKSADCPPLEALAVKIQAHAQSFSLEELEKSLLTFPTLVNHLELSINSIPS